MKLFDIAIIGGGLSGSATAANLSKKGYSVIIFEKNSKGKVVPCAGGMASSMQKYLPLDINEALETEVKSVHFSWKYSDKVIAELSGDSPFCIVKREILDKLLLTKAISYGAVIKTSTHVEGLNNESELWSITCKDLQKYKSKFLVIADGSESEWATKLGLGPSKPKFANTVALRLEGSGDIEKNSVKFDFGSIKYGFAWAFPLKGYTNIGLGTFIGKYDLDNEILINKIINDFGFENKKVEPISKQLRIWNGFHKLHSERVVVVGDAASLCDPFLAEGIRPSILSSFYAADCIDKCLSTKSNNLSEYTNIMNLKWSQSMAWGKRIAEVFYRFPRTGYNLGVKRKTAPQRIAQILAGEMSYSDIAKRVIKRLLLQ